MRRILCKIGIHKWNVCKCSICLKVRPHQYHDWEGCRCRQCGFTRNEGHEWKLCECIRCGYRREHVWKNDHCELCGSIRRVCQTCLDEPIVDPCPSCGGEGRECYTDSDYPMWHSDPSADGFYISCAKCDGLGRMVCQSCKGNGYLIEPPPT